MQLPGRLDSWKEIAQYIGRDVSTAIRWERERGLPVHRVPGSKRGSVYALTDEIDRWLAGTPLAPIAPGRRHRHLPLVLVALSLVAVAASLVVGRGGASPAASGRIGRVAFEARALVARGEDGGVLWSYALADRVDLDLVSDPLASGHSLRYAVADLDGDGRLEVVASVPLRDTDDSGAVDDLICLSSGGALLWRARLEDRVAFRGGLFGPPWLDGHVAVYRAAGQARIVWSLQNHTWWPSLLVVLDGRGRRLSALRHPGYIRALRVSEISGRPVVLFGGINNAFRSAFLAAVDGESLRGCAPAPAGSDYEGLDCEPAPLLRYFLFPPSEIGRASGLPYNSTKEILAHRDEIEVDTNEAARGAPVASTIFRFSRDLQLLEARPSDCWPAHEALQQAGKITHSVAECPMYREPARVREWHPGGAWADLKPVRPITGGR